MLEGFGMAEKAEGVNDGLVERITLKCCGDVRRMPVERVAKKVYKRIGEGIKEGKKAKGACNDRRYIYIFFVLATPSRGRSLEEKRVGDKTKLN